MIAYCLVVLGLLVRLVPHVPNMVPVAAIAIFAGAYLNKKIALWVPLAIMVASDLLIGLHDVVFYTWGAILLTSLMGMWLRNNKNVTGILGVSVLSAVVFFLITNFGAWIGWYPHTKEGFISCYVNAIPFFRNTLASNVIFSLVFFGVYEFAKKKLAGTKMEPVLIAQ